MDFQIWLDNWADTVLDNNFEAFVSNMSFPFRMVTPQLSWELIEAEQARKGFDAYRNLLMSKGATTVVRSLRSVDRIAEDRAVLRYENNILRDTIRVFAPSGAETVVQKFGDIWKAVEVTETEFAEDYRLGLQRTRSDLLHATVRQTT